MKKIYAGKILVRYCLPVCLALQAQILPVQADSYVYDTANTDVAPHYLDEAIWTTAGAPATGDSVYLTAATSSVIDVYFRYQTTAPYFDTVSVDNTGGGVTTLWSSGSVTTPLLSSRVVYLGASGSGAFKPADHGRAKCCGLYVSWQQFYRHRHLHHDRRHSPGHG